MKVTPEQRAQIQATGRRLSRPGGPIGTDEIGFEPSWETVAEIKGRDVSLGRDEEGQLRTSKGGAALLYCRQTGGLRVVALDMTSQIASITRDEARRLFPDAQLDEINKAVSRSRRQRRRRQKL